MGYYYDSSDRPPDEDKPPGCLDALLITRAVFGVIMWPVLALFALFGVLAAIFVLFTIHPILGLIPIALAVVGLYFFARWEQKRFRPPGL